MRICTHSVAITKMGIAQTRCSNVIGPLVIGVGSDCGLLYPHGELSRPPRRERERERESAAGGGSIRRPATVVSIFIFVDEERQWHHAGNMI